jgi:hydroxymethylglutaryl-CoA lyase
MPQGLAPGLTPKLPVMLEVPKSVRLREVGPRDGFQNEPETIATADKVRLIDMLSGSGLKRLEVTSFVRPDVIPQLADAEQVLAAIERRAGVAFSVLIPNERGLERALAMRERFDEINVFLSASETHNRKNVNRSIEESLVGLEATLATAGEAGLRREGVISTSFGCPYEGEVQPERVFEIAERLAAAGCEEVGFGDTTGMANPRQVREFFAAARERLAGVELTAHFHNTRGQGLANVLAALEEGIDSFEASFGELGAARLDRQRLQRGPRLDAARDGNRDRDRPRPAGRGLARSAGGARPATRRPPAERRPRRLAPRGLRFGASVAIDTVTSGRPRPWRLPRERFYV